MTDKEQYELDYAYDLKTKEKVTELLDLCCVGFTDRQRINLCKLIIRGIAAAGGFRSSPPPGKN